MKRSHSIASMLKTAFKRKQCAQPGYSLRALARDLGVSAAFASNILSGKKQPPKDRFERFIYCLELDILEREQLLKHLLPGGISVKVLGRTPPSKNLKKRRTAQGPVGNLLGSWVNLAILEGLTLDQPHCDLANLRTRLGVSASELDRVLHSLASAGVIEQRNGCWVKKDEQLYVAGGRSRKEVRQFHEMMILKAREELTKKTAHADYQRRLINGFTITLDPEKIEALKIKIFNFLDELSQEASAGYCSEVYQCNFQFFPLTTKVIGDS